MSASHPTNARVRGGANAIPELGHMMLKVPKTDELMFYFGDLVPKESTVRIGDVEVIHSTIDRAKGGHAHRDALAAALAALADPDSTPSARVLQATQRDYGNSFVKFGIARSRAHRDEIMKLPLAPEVAERFAQLAEESIKAQQGYNVIRWSRSGMNFWVVSDLERNQLEKFVAMLKGQTTAT